MNFLIDTSVISQTRKPTPVPEVARWWQQHSAFEMGISVMTVHELRYGVEMAPAGAKRKDLERWLVEFVIPGFSGGLLAIDRAVADASARLIASCRKTGHTPELEDALIAATAIVHGLQLATLNRKHFERLGVELVKF